MIRATVIKFGGEIVESLDTLNNLASSIAKLHEQREPLILIHGGGPLATGLSQRLGLIPKMIGGRRITCGETLEVMKMTLPGIVNSNILAMLKKFNLPAVAVSGISILSAKKRPPKAVSGSNGEIIDFGFVGDVTDIDVTFLQLLLDKNYIPVISPLTADAQGQILNINADTVATQIANKISAKSFVAITKIGGVFKNIDDKNSKISKATMAEAKKMIADGIIQGGMIPKVEEGFGLLEKNLDFFHIVGIDTKEMLINEIKNPGSEGSVITK